MAVNYELIQNNLNEYGKYILTCIKTDYDESFSKEKKEILHNLLKEENFIIVDKPTIENIKFFSLQNKITDESKFNITQLPSAHGGRTKNDNKIHIYPDSKAFENKSSEEIIKDCIDNIIIHEIFHYFIKTDKENNNNEYEEKFSHFLNEGLVQLYAEKFSLRYNLGKQQSNYDKEVKTAANIISTLPLENIDKIVFNSDYKELLEKSSNGNEIFSLFVKNINFKKDLKSIIVSLGSELGMTENDPQVLGFVNHYSKIDDKEILLADLTKVVEKININDDKKRYYKNELNKIR